MTAQWEIFRAQEALAWLAGERGVELTISTAAEGAQAAAAARRTRRSSRSRPTRSPGG